MSDYYHHFLSSMAGAGGQAIGNQAENSPPIPHHQTIPMPGPPLPNPYQSLGYFTGFPEPIMFNAPKAQRSRRKSAPGLDHIKHRRTRSGCYTCRSRRVKVWPLNPQQIRLVSNIQQCDEVRPICESMPTILCHTAMDILLTFIQGAGKGKENAIIQNRRRQKDQVVWAPESHLGKANRQVLVLPTAATMTKMLDWSRI